MAKPKPTPQNKMPVSVDIGILQLQNLTEDGWYTEGEKIKLNGREFIWYMLNSGEKKIPCSPNDDCKGEYIWERVLVEDIVKRQHQNWIVRNVCSKTNRIWVCKKRQFAA